MTGRESRSNLPAPPRRRAWRAGVFAAAMIAGALACAVQVPPSGGPEDTNPPRVAGTVPARDSTGVAVNSPIAITFSDDMTRARVERSVLVQPPVSFERVRWDGRTLIIQTGDMQRDTTYVVRVKPGYRDNHNVPAKAQFEFAFATGASLDTARVEGVVYFKHEPSGRALVRCFRLPREEDFDPVAARPDRESPTAKDGTYRLRYLPDNDARFLVLAFIDVNGNGALDPPGEPMVVYPDTVFLTAAVPVVQGLDLTIIDPNEPAQVSGLVSNETGIDSVLASVVLEPVADSTLARVYTLCNEAGAFEFSRVRAGEYLLRAFLDLRADSLCGAYDCPDSALTACMEPCSEAPDTLRLEPGATVKVPPLALRRKESP
ncbi:MAG: Ig-like domain-containing protein [Candidatus Krumholzibacteria bacterium]|nr:Ig-like domain-containing protein [Candidatus Krumholzibacteria bacterium]MDH4337150.1 Ig-like domain-containing protein [Candidatus Krumholzibacteria bacterium]MDH5269132.1 Ig-like domain-containing protein [Candidatus Krumholzibacteria bacterium]